MKIGPQGCKVQVSPQHLNCEGGQTAPWEQGQRARPKYLSEPCSPRGFSQTLGPRDTDSPAGQTHLGPVTTG